MHVPCKRRDDEDFLKAEDSLRVHALAEVEVRELGPGLGIRGREVEEVDERRDGLSGAAHGAEEGDLALTERLD